MSRPNLTTRVWDIEADDFPTTASLSEQARFLLNYAILAPSSHNSQPWEFDINDGDVEIRAAEDRWLEIADGDKRELNISLGCAVENLRLAARRFGLEPTIRYQEDSPPVEVALEPDGRGAPDRTVGLFDQITERRTNHHLYRDDPVPAPLRKQLRATVADEPVTLALIEEPERKTAVARLQAEADRRQMENPAYRKELGYWIGIGALGDAWLKARAAQAVVSFLDIGASEAKKNSQLIQSAPIVGVLETNSESAVARLRTGQLYERLALQASADGLAVHPMSQILERPEQRAELTALLDSETGVPQHLFRLGYPEETESPTPRWPPEQVMAEHPA